MALVIKRLYEGLVLLEEFQDPRTYGDPFVSSPLCLVGIVGFYVYFFQSLGPKLMEHRKPFNVKNSMIVYNIVQIVLNSYLTVEGIRAILQMQHPLCQDVDYSDSPHSQLCIRIGRIYTYLKIFDIGDTLFFLLRKSYRQISFLHLYHHCGMITLVWIGFRYYTGGSAIWIGTINAFVHCVMFTYYLMTAIDSKWKHSLTFKRSLTQLQLVQFATFVFIFGKITLWPTCNLPTFLTLLFTIQNFFMMFLFGDFYVKTYILKSKTS